jgi:hypothetical protein
MEKHVRVHGMIQTWCVAASPPSEAWQGVAEA